MMRLTDTLTSTTVVPAVYFGPAPGTGRSSYELDDSV